VADLHVVQNLGQSQSRGATDPGWGQEAGEQQGAAGDLQPALGLDHAADVLGVAFTQVHDDPPAKLVEFVGKGLNLLRS
jgi:hypothetical protein